MRRLVALAFAAAVLSPQTSAAQGVAVAVHGGTLGLGASLVYGVAPSVNVRGTVGFIPTDPDFTVDDVDFTVDFPTFMRGTVDFYPTGFFYLSGGALLVTRSGDINVEGRFNGSQEFGGNTYTGSDVGTLTGVFSLSRFMPYLGVGFGNPVGRRVGLNLDIGLGFGSEPTVELGATGPIASDPTFQSDLEAREAEIQGDIPTFFKYYPVVSLAVSVGLGG